MASTTKISELAEVISSNTAIVDRYFISNNLPTPSFEVDGPSTIIFPPHEKDVAAAYSQVLSATLELHTLMKGPTDMLLRMATLATNDTLSLQAVYRLNLAFKVPLERGISYADLSNECKLNERDLRRLIRHAMTNKIFKEKNSLVVHTAASKLLVSNPAINGLVGIQVEEYFPSATKTVEAMMKYDGVHSPGQSGFSLANNTTKGLYEEFNESPVRSRRFAAAMGGFASRIPIQPLAQKFDWASCTNVVDVGGAQGPVSTALAKLFPNTKFVVQDYAEAVAEGKKKVAGDESAMNVEFMEYNFLTEQTVLGADVYYFRAIFHNWPDESCVEILRNQIPAMKKGAHILIEENLTGPKSQALYREKIESSMDLTMLTYFGGAERTAEDLTKIAHMADPKFKVVSASQIEGTPSSLVNIVWEGGE
ncbi:O-methyltransferase-domain-containing protein [Amylocarpus encephaloides]|uniref:O-methyltransferase-domain-containing protein n=1 Tax=Amylocarpus encephaloides TaxID=45428 RepID=A0A9P8C6K2_9HELO|nr:O-methyltransferase-domain-containing protein [Amylocarpus encephaloides]